MELQVSLYHYQILSSLSWIAPFLWLQSTIAVYQDNLPGEYTRTVHQESLPGQSTGVHQDSTPGEFTRTIRQESTPGQSTRRVYQENSPGEYTRTVHQESLPGQFARRVHQDSPPGESTKRAVHLRIAVVPLLWNPVAFFKTTPNLRPHVMVKSFWSENAGSTLLVSNQNFPQINSYYWTVSVKVKYCCYLYIIQAAFPTS